MRGINDDELADFVELTRTLPINVRFIEYMPFDGNVWSDTKMVSYADMMPRVVAAYPQGLERLRVSIIHSSTADCNASIAQVLPTWRVQYKRDFMCILSGMVCEPSTVLFGTAALTQGNLGAHALCLFWHG